MSPSATTRHTTDAKEETPMTIAEATTRTVEVPGATLTYDVRPGGSNDARPLFLIG